MKREPLVSVAVVTYNVSKTVIETLESIKAQTYPYIELVVSDDCSTDGTVDICRKWIEANKDRFVRTELVTVEKNTGISANHNRLEANCRGEWVKPIDSDDILLPDCVETFVNYVSDHPDAVYVWSDFEVFGGEEKDREAFYSFYANNTKSFFKSSIEEQYDFITMVGDCIPPTSSFFNRAAVESLGIRNDERIPFMDDTPRWINLLKKQVRFHYIDKPTARYRMSDTSMARNTPQKFDKSRALLYVHYCFSNNYRKGDKRIAILQWLRSQRTIHNNTIVWKVIVKLYKVLFAIN